MILYILVTVITVLLGFLINNQPVQQTNGITRQQMLNRLSLFTLFLILFGISALRLNVGNDYAKYVEFMHLIRCNAVVPTEIGFNGIVSAIYSLSGFENYLLVFAFFAFATLVLDLFAIYHQSDSFGFSFFLFMTFGLYFQSFNTVRYYLALALALYAIPFVLKREWAKFVLVVLLGCTLHKSILVILILYPLASFTWKKWQLAVAAVFCSSFFFLQDFYLKLVIRLYPTYEDTEYLEGGTSIINILRCMGILVFALLYYKQAVKDKPRNRFYFYCNLGALVLYTCCSFLPIISRIGYYLTVTHIFFLPAIIGSISDEKQKKFWKYAVYLAAVVYFIVFILRKAGGDGLRILPYQTFLFHDMVPILSDVN